MRGSINQSVDGKLVNGFDYENQAWVLDGKYQACGHLEACACYGKAHAGEPAV